MFGAEDRAIFEYQNERKKKQLMFKKIFLLWDMIQIISMNIQAGREVS